MAFVGLLNLGTVGGGVGVATADEAGDTGLEDVADEVVVLRRG